MCWSHFIFFCWCFRRLFFCSPNLLNNRYFTAISNQSALFSQINDRCFSGLYFHKNIWIILLRFYERAHTPEAIRGPAFKHYFNIISMFKYISILISFLYYSSYSLEMRPLEMQIIPFNPSECLFFLKKTFTP